VQTFHKPVKVKLSGKRTLRRISLESSPLGDTDGANLSGFRQRACDYLRAFFFFYSQSEEAHMTNFPANLKYAQSDEWFDPSGGKIGISDFAQSQLSDVVFVEILVSEGDQIKKGDQIASVESVKAAAEAYSPVSGKVVAVNSALSDSPELINSDPFGAAWFIQIEGGDAAELLDAATYQANCESRDH
jgi:glycine cleavage system H protein